MNGNKITLESLQGWWENPFSKDGVGMYYVKGNNVFIKNAQIDEVLKISGSRKVTMGKYTGMFKNNGKELSWDSGKIIWTHIGELPDMYDPGTKSGRFKYTALLGKGANGVVVEAIDVSAAVGRSAAARQTVAIKVLHFDGVESVREKYKSALRLHCECQWSSMFLHNTQHQHYNAKQARFFLEYYEDHTGFPAESQAHLLDPEHARRLEQRTEVAKLPYIVMELAKGTLAWKALFDTKETCSAAFTKKDRRNITWQLASALEYLGKFELLHRDLHFHNLFVTPASGWGGQLTVTIGDLGMMSHQTHAVCFAPYDEEGWKMRDWVPWEAWNTNTSTIKAARKVTAASQVGGQSFDVFSLGVIHLYLCLGQVETRRILDSIRSGQAGSSSFEGRGELLKQLILDPEFALRLVRKDPSGRPKPGDILDALPTMGTLDSVCSWFSKWFLHHPTPHIEASSSESTDLKRSAATSVGPDGAKAKRARTGSK